MKVKEAPLYVLVAVCVVLDYIVSMFGSILCHVPFVFEDIYDWIVLDDAEWPTPQELRRWIKEFLKDTFESSILD